MASLTLEQLAQLEQLAKSATPGPWSTTPPPDDDGFMLGVKIGTTRGGQIYATPPGGQYPLADARFIAAASPDVVLALIEAARATLAVRKQDPTTIADVFRARIAEEGVPLYVIAERLRMSTTTVGNIVNGRSLPGPKVARRLSRFLRLTVEQIAEMVAAERAKQQPISSAEALP